jgi:hypothetical protein
MSEWVAGQRVICRRYIPVPGSPCIDLTGYYGTVYAVEAAKAASENPAHQSGYVVVVDITGCLDDAPSRQHLSADGVAPTLTFWPDELEKAD